MRPKRGAEPVEDALFDWPVKSDADDFLPRVDDLIGSLVEESEEPTSLLAAEVAVGLLLGIGFLGGEDDTEWRRYLLSRLEAAGVAKSADLIAALAALSGERVRAKAIATLDRCTDATAMLSGLEEPIAAISLRGLADQHGYTWALAATFSRAGDQHAFVLAIEPNDCGAASELLLMEADDVDLTLREVRRYAAKQQRKLTEITLERAEFRWQAEVAMDARAVHDELDLEADQDFAAADLLDDDGPGYYAVAPLLRARLGALAESEKPKPRHGVIARRPGSGTIFQLRVDIRGSKPPIWRRLEVPSDIKLARLHNVLQTAFDWTDSHLHVFETDAGRFGQPDADLGIRSERNVRLDQVAGQGDKVTYIYDFGDDWEHIIRVERAMPKQEGVNYPRCTGGRRAAPPEDCGGVWGYENLICILADPGHEEHEQRLWWLGLDSPRDFDPGAFDPDLINKALSSPRK